VLPSGESVCNNNKNNTTLQSSRIASRVCHFQEVIVVLEANANAQFTLFSDIFEKTFTKHQQIPIITEILVVQVRSTALLVMSFILIHCRRTMGVRISFKCLSKCNQSTFHDPYYQ